LPWPGSAANGANALSIRFTQRVADRERLDRADVAAAEPLLDLGRHVRAEVLRLDALADDEQVVAVRAHVALNRATA
jgi:hypothetical protein